MVVMKRKIMSADFWGEVVRLPIRYMT